MNCTFCGGKIKASSASVTVNVAEGHEHEAPAGTFHAAVDNNCFRAAVLAHNAVRSHRLIGDVETVLGVE